MSKKKSKEAPAAPTATLSLAVKHRPRVLKDVVGNPTEIAAIKGMIKSRKYPGAILLAGATGCGKTTLARILATYMNADDPKNVRESQAFKLGEKHPDLRIVNAATDGKVEDIRTLVKGSYSAPLTNYRIIVIDEAHKLTGASAEALLVPLEEPPARTIWILCTTNPEKLTKTISDRCTKIVLKTVEPEEVYNRLLLIAEAEGFKWAEKKEGKKALKLAAQFGDGSVRGSIAIMEKLAYAIESGDIDAKAEGALTHFVESSAVDLDKAAASIVAAALKLDLPGLIAIIRKAENPRGIVYKSRFLLDFLIGTQTKTAKFTPYSGRVFLDVAKKHSIKFGLTKLIMLQQAINEVELSMNSCPIDEAVLLQTRLGSFVIEHRSE